MSLAHFEPVLELGKRLVLELKAHDDLLTAWMAHDIAARMKAVEVASTAEIDSARDACAAAILSLWRHRNVLPKHLAGLAKFEPVIKTMAALNVEDTEHYFYAPALREAAVAAVDGETKQWLDFAIGLDYSARLMIQYALEMAASSSGDGAAEWVKLATAAGEGDFPERLVLRFTRGGGAVDPVEVERKRLRDKLGRLKIFSVLAMAATEDLEAKLAKLPESTDRDALDLDAEADEEEL